MVKLSVVIITFNEERNIARCLASVKGVADEIVVVDSFSTDRTAEICASFGVRFLQHPFTGYIEQKNYALGCAAFDHILSMDADEALSPELEKSILDVKSSWTHEAFTMNRLTNYCGQFIRHGGWYPDRKIRLFKKGKGKWAGENPHDRYVPENPQNTQFLKGDLLHYSYYSIEEHIAQVNKFSSIGARSALAAGKRGSLVAIIFKPFYRFIRDYFLLAGFLDGYKGFLVAVISAHATFLKYTKLRVLQNEKR